jgi:hypothetical protein
MQQVFRQREQESVTGAFGRGTTCFVDVQQVFRQRKQNSVTGAFARPSVILFLSHLSNLEKHRGGDLEQSPLTKKKNLDRTMI